MNRGIVKLQLFLIGLFSLTQVHFFGSMGISEFVMFAIGPVLFFKNYQLLRKDGFLPMVWLSIFTCIGCIVSNVYNDVDWVLGLKGLASPYSLFSTIVVAHALLRRNLDALPWFIVGCFLSGIVNVFAFRPESAVMSATGLLQGDEATEYMTSNVLFWTSKISSGFGLPISAWYLQTPTVYAVCVYLATVAYMLLSSGGSGRSMAMSIIVSLLFVVVGGKSRNRMKVISKHFFLFAITLALTLGIFKFVYSYTARTGILGEQAKSKYLKQTEGGNSTLKLLMGGRMEFFVGVIACLDSPIIGFGYKAADEKGYAGDFLYKYGNEDDYKLWEREVRGSYLSGKRMLIPAHSHIACFWLYYGIFGLILWLYVLYLIFDYIRHHIHVIPQWYCYLACGACAMVWNIFFSPYGSRVSVPFYIACILLVRAVSKGSIPLPLEMEEEAQKFDIQYSIKRR